MVLAGLPDGGPALAMRARVKKLRHVETMNLTHDLGHGRIATMNTAETLIALLPEGDVVPLATLSKIAPAVDRDIRTAMAREGIVTPTGELRGLGGSYVISRDDAVLVLVAVALAMLAGAAVITIARVIRESGLDPMALARDMKV